MLKYNGGFKMTNMNGINMTKSLTLKKNKLMLEGLIFTEVLKKFNNTIIEDSFPGIKRNLELCLDEFPILLREYLEAENRITRIRKLIQIQGIVEECKEYLEVVSKTKSQDIYPILAELDKFSHKFEETHYSLIS
jgi:hypothetical protein